MDDDTRHHNAPARYIPGIYNYCDRWCERCRFASRCLNSAITDERCSDLAAYDLHNAAFWNQLTDAMEETLALLQRIAETEGIDLTPMTAGSQTAIERPGSGKTIISMVAHMAGTYAEQVDRWFEARRCRLPAGPGQPDGQPASGPEPVAAAVAEITPADALAVVRWYQHQIPIKLQRALRSRKDEALCDAGGLPRDSDGSAKVALIGIDRSISAWGHLARRLPGPDAALARLVSLLTGLRERVENAFPDARAFVRPGFDEPGR